MPKCALCQQRSGKRNCPALGAVICQSCCGTKRRVEVACPDSCVYLEVAREHPATAERRRQEQDVALLSPSIKGLTERQFQLFYVFHSVIAARSESGQTIRDLEVAEACRRLREAVGAGHALQFGDDVAGHPGAVLLAGAMQAVLQELRAQGGTIYDGEVLIALQSIERGAQSLASPDAPRAYIDLVGRLLPHGRDRIAVSGIAP